MSLLAIQTAIPRRAIVWRRAYEKSCVGHNEGGVSSRTPDAQATLEGIMTWLWWERARERQMAELEEMLAEFIATELVLKHKGKDGRTRYSLNPRKVSEIRALLKEWGRDPAC